MKFVLLSLISSFILLSCHENSAQGKKTDKILKGKSFSIMSYNVENLFDTIDDKHSNDNEYLPKSKLNWNSKKYQTKLEHISKVIAAVDTPGFPLIIGLIECENRKVIEDLTKKPLLIRQNYQIVHFESKDPRGIDLALLYRPDSIRLLDSELLSDVPNSSGIQARGILYAQFLVANRDTIHLLLNHWKSRRGGKEETEDKRINQALALRNTIDKILSGNPNAQIIAMGDFNDEAKSQSIQNVLKSNGPNPFINLTENYSTRQDAGSTYYNGKWITIDHCLVSGSFYNDKSYLQTNRNYSTIFNDNWLLVKSPKGKIVPWRTASGAKYHGGYSDHLPVVTKIFISKH